jgi:predicted HicB family RNase H-like nuclease
MSDNVMLVVRMPPKLKAQLEAAAAADRRTLSDFVRLRLEELVAKPKRRRR